MSFLKGHIVTDEMRKKMSLSHRGKPSPRKGVKLSKKTIEKIKKSLKPIWNSKEYKEKARLRVLGKKQSNDTILKRVNSRKWYKHSKETIKKISQSNRKKIHKTDESKLWRRRIEYKEWREGVFKRDDYICKKCKIIGNKLHPHHIENFCDNIEMRFEIKNGITFCEKCHKEFHKKYGQRKNNNKQVKNFIK